MHFTWTTFTSNDARTISYTIRICLVLDIHDSRVWSVREGEGTTTCCAFSLRGFREYW